MLISPQQLGCNILLHCGSGTVFARNIFMNFFYPSKLECFFLFGLTLYALETILLMSARLLNMRCGVVIFWREYPAWGPFSVTCVVFWNEFDGVFTPPPPYLIHTHDFVWTETGTMRLPSCLLPHLSSVLSRIEDVWWIVENLRDSNDSSPPT